MPRTVRFLFPLIAGLALLATLGYQVLPRTTSRWFTSQLGRDGAPLGTVVLVHELILGRLAASGEPRA